MTYYFQMDGIEALECDPNWPDWVKISRFTWGPRSVSNLPEQGRRRWGAIAFVAEVRYVSVFRLYKMVTAGMTVNSAKFDLVPEKAGDRGLAYTFDRAYVEYVAVSDSTVTFWVEFESSQAYDAIRYR